MRTAPAIGFRCRRSPLLVAVTLVVAALAAVAAYWTGPRPWLHRLLLLVVIAAVLAAVRGLRRPKVSAVLWRAEGGADIRVHGRAGQAERTIEGMVQSGRVLGPLIVLTLRWPPRERAHLWLLPDNLDADTRRRLRMRLGASGSGQLASGGADSP